MKNLKMLAILRVLTLVVFGFVALLLVIGSAAIVSASEQRRDPQQSATATPTPLPPRIPDDIPDGTGPTFGPTFGPVWMPSPENAGGTFGPVWHVADEVLAAVTAKVGDPSRLQYSAESGEIQSEFKRDQTVQLNYLGFAPNQSVNVGLYRYDDQAKTLTLMNGAMIQTDSQGLVSASLPVPPNAPGGHYFLAACGLAGCNPESIFTQINDPQIVWGSFSVPPRVEDLSVSVAPDVSNATDMFNTLWKPDTPLQDDIVRIVVYRDGKLYTEQTINFANPVDRSLFLNREGTGTQLYTQLPQEKIWPGISNVAPKLNRWIPGANRLLQNQPIDSGDYRVEMYVNSVLEAATEMSVEK